MINYKALLLSLCLYTVASGDEAPPTPTPRRNSSRANEIRLTIDLSSTGLQRIGRKFLSSPAITSLHLEDNQIWTVDDGAFEDLPNLQYLNLADSWLPYSKITYDFPKLKTLVLDNALVPITAEDLEATFTNHCSPCLKKEEQRRLEYFGLTVEITGKMPRLEKLHLRNNKISQLTGLENTPNVTHLHLGGNEIVPEFFTATFPSKLSHLYLENNSIEWFHNFSLMPQLEELVLDHNSIYRLCSGISCSRQKRNTYEQEARVDLAGAVKLKKLSIADNLLMEIDVDAFVDLESLVFLNLSNNYIEQLPADVFGNLTTLGALILSHNMMREIPDIDDMENLEILMLNGNVIRAVAGDEFSNLPKLKTLSFASNALTQIDAGSFDALTSLSELDLSGNKLLTLPENWISCGALRRLHLDGNLFADIENMSLNNITMIEYLGIGGNPLKMLSMEDLMELPRTTVINIRAVGGWREVADGRERCHCDNSICDRKIKTNYDGDLDEVAK